MARWRVVVDWIVTTLASGWWAVMAVVRVAWACRAPILSVAAGFGLIAFTDQARDIVIASGAPSLYGSSGIFVAVLFWTVFGWYWARTTLDYAFVCPLPGPDAPPWRRSWQGFWADHVPRLIGFLGIFSVAYAFWKAHTVYAAALDDLHADAFRRDAWHYATYAVAFYLLVWVRRPALRALVQRTNLISSPDIANWLAPSVAPIPRIVGLCNPLTLAVLVASLIASPVFYTLVALDPVGLSAFFRGAVPAVLFGLALIVPVTSVLVILSARLCFPVFGAVLVWFVVGPLVLGDLHDVRTCRGLAQSSDAARRCAVAVERPLLRQAFFDWWQANRAFTPPIGATDVVAPPIVVVATAGGASRAAFWTTQVLGEIASREDHFADRLFMLSGVSGGSLGAVTFRSIVEADRRASADGKGSPRLADAARDGAKVIENDFLGPALTMAFYVDLPSALGLPFLLPPGWRPDDRAAALEKAWEQAWAQSGISHGDRRFTWEDGFTSVFGGASPWPLLVLNGTSIEKGKRIITSNARFWTDGATNPQNLSGGVNRYDTFDITHSDIPVSTAVTMSARFPVISPSGALEDETGKLRARVTDGGLFENFGAMTADEVLRYLVSRVSEVQNGQYPVVPIAILISNDPAIDELLLRRDGTKNPATPDCPPTAESARPLPTPHPGNGWPECPVDPSKSARLLVDPVLALYDGRVARGVAAATALFDRITDFRLLVRDRLLAHGVPDIDALQARLGLDDHTDFFHFRQCRLDGMKSPTMSWHDSAEAWSAMRKMLGLDKDASGAIPDSCGNQAEFFRLCVRLARLGGDATDDQAATDACAARWPRPAAWTCTVEHDGRRPYCRLE
ncbi:hypothetical protein [Enhydrobacter sp.]|jgi:hypothetical protein|uniref:hypothetical protein n=1 Tax=Enhydrobacter sp. TaxID=1894999 RepID=UPI00261BCFDA|nr:hypothetical protein [Enhydrobacter sp.]WIM12760.1 MAG: hypothetical protein OJF58_003723 [Enhydrobacter sp.]